MEKTKKCKHCQSEIDAKAKRCPHCQGDLRGWFARHPIWTGILGFLFLVWIIGVFSGGKSSTTDNVNSTSDKVKQSTVESSSLPPSATPTQEAETVQQSGKVEVKSHKKQINYTYPTIVGEVINNTQRPASYVKVTSTYYDKEGGVVGTDFTFAGDTASTPLQPGSTAPFEISDINKTEFETYKLDVTWN